MWCGEHTTEPATEAAKPTRRMLSIASERVPNLHDHVKRLKAKMRKSNGHREEAAASNYLKLDLVSVVVLIRMPSKEEENEDGVLPELVFAIQDVSVVG